MSSITKVVFPTPPPTTNDLSSRQRTQLLRKAKKLEQIFGATPRLVYNTLEPSGEPTHYFITFPLDGDISTDPIHIALPRRPSQHRQTNDFRGSCDSSSSTSSCESPLLRKQDPPGNSPSICNSQVSSTFPVSPIDSCQTRPDSAKVPVMRLFMKSPTLETVPASPSANNTSSSLRQSPIDRKSDVLFTQFTVIPDEDASLRNSTTPNSYNLISLNSLRKQKMDRLRRKLGQDVPFDLVFPSSSDTESEQEYPPAPPRLRRRSGRISTARDSISGPISVHRAKRQSITRQINSSPEPKQVTTRLSLIIESPDEHGVGCAQEFGHPPKSEQGTKFKSEWTTEVKLWSTRRGYEGWRPIESHSNASQTPRTMSSSIPLPLPPSVPLNTELKKKPSSYRKPVPRV